MSDSDKPYPSSVGTDYQRVMKVTEVSEYLRVHRATIYRLLRHQAIPAFRIGSDWRFNREDIDAWRLQLGGQVDDTAKRVGEVRPEVRHRPKRTK
jgi:excisionase family DNA binding protein